jgi:hypothetical protein
MMPAARIDDLPYLIPGSIWSYRVHMDLLAMLGF